MTPSKAPPSPGNWQGWPLVPSKVGAAVELLAPLLLEEPPDEEPCPEELPLEELLLAVEVAPVDPVWVELPPEELLVLPVEPPLEELLPLALPHWHAP